MSEGERLKAKRATLGRSLEDISSELRISRKYIRGIEEGDYAGFPARVFTVGFIKSYAAFLDLDPEPLIQEYVASNGEHPGNESHQTVAVSPQWVEKARERGHRMAYYLVAAFVVLLLGSGLSWYSTRSARQPVATPPVAARTAPQSPQATGSHSQDNAIPAAASPGADNIAPRATAPVFSPDNASGLATPAVLPPYNLYLEASDQTWLMYSMDDAEPLDTMLYPGDKLSIQAHRKIFLKLGNAGGVVGTLNGRRMPAFGDRGQVRVVTLGK